MAKPFTKKGWLIFKTIAGAIDIIQEVITPTWFGAVVNAIADPVIGLVFGIIYWRKGAINAKSFIALIISLLGEEGSISEAPLWILDVWYTQISAPKIEIEQKKAAGAVYMNQNNTDGPLNRGNIRPPDISRQRPLNIKDGGISVRPPSL